jgi:Leucine-rich repeat (LRR) protein
MINHIPERRALVVLAEQEPHDLRVELSRFAIKRVTIYGTPKNLGALSDYPELEEVSLRKCEIADLQALRSLSRLRRLEVAFGSLSSADLGFCSGTLESLVLSRLRRLKDLSVLPSLPKLEYLELSHLHGFLPPDFRSFPDLRHLSIWNTDWSTLSWLEHLPMLEALHLSQCKVADQDWRPILQLKRLRYLHGMKDVFKGVAAREFMRLRPQVRVDQGIPADLGKHPEIEEYFEGGHREEGR